MRSFVLFAAVCLGLLSLNACGSEDDPGDIGDEEQVTATVEDVGGTPFCQGTWFNFGSGHGSGGMVCMCPGGPGSGSCHTCQPAWYQSNGGYCNGGGPTGPGQR